VLLLPRAVLCEVGEAWMTPCGYGADGGGFFDAGHDPQHAAAVIAPAHVDAEDALEALRLRSSSGASRRGCGGRCCPQSIRP